MDELPDNSMDHLPVEELAPVQEAVDRLHEEMVENVAASIMPPFKTEEPKTEEEKIIAKAKEDYDLDQERARFLSPQKSRSFEG